MVGFSIAVEAYKIAEIDSAKIINYRSMDARGKLGEYERNTRVSRGVFDDLQRPSKDRDQTPSQHSRIFGFWPTVGSGFHCLLQFVVFSHLVCPVVFFFSYMVSGSLGQLCGTITGTCRDCGIKTS